MKKVDEQAVLWGDVRKASRRALDWSGLVAAWLAILLCLLHWLGKF